MNHFLLIIFGFFTFGCSIQTKLKEINTNTAKFLINSSVVISVKGKNKGRIRNAVINFLRRLSNRTGVFIGHGFPLKKENSSINITFKNIAKLIIHDDESYSLKVNSNTIEISAKIDIGVLRSLETLVQLVTFDESGYYSNGVSINDVPRFVWRGLMIDVARHFQPIILNKRLLLKLES
jgi:hexosaminidase